ncbi:nitric-oxide synthase [Aspergillus niger ATCC 1015]|uniref:nitric-oxide synthase (NADPH) n=1 Tax=Aspergillus niger (strain ATCC 1015 / CBS 113.46 / FGSC A1144 / LSHB Ac4 / NCTC 3858a / NRRL 328 / USDA 3528.7) TaxID=380704 RepID=G3XX93_ASPNA|nr:nitric-oxide synthase [Aspergillus niger ATCC 1015]
MPSTEINHTRGATPSPRCPFVEYERILEKNPILAPTGCTDKFCQAGRLIHSDEPKVGENRPLEVVQNEAVAFLWQLWQDGVYTEDCYLERRTQVLEEIARSAKQTIVWEQESKRVDTTSIWTQSPEELRYGLRLAWRNSRKCIMRSRYQELELCDLRHIHTSVGMATALLEEVTKAFNHGQIKPTVFVFPPKSVDGSGPMFWNKQVLNFAGVCSPSLSPLAMPISTDVTGLRNPQYELEDGSIMGDPSNVKLTQDIVDLGWTPPRAKTRWDLLPIVAMAENDAPALVEVPDDLRRLIEIQHPDYPSFNELGLRWYQFPALSRLGFDIGGVQYMDAEIGVRNLADTFRFDALPEVVKAIGFDIDAYRAKSEYAEVQELEDLPDYEQLRWQSRAQAELNYAVRWSFLQQGVTCVGTLAASADWCQFDDEHAAKKGYRLNSDPYWLSPPQGSIVPVWHRGGAPNYQPKPMICRNRYDPVNSWQRRKGSTDADPVFLIRKGNEWVTKPLTSFLADIPSRKRRKLIESQKKEKPSTVHIYYCSQGTTARTLAERLHRRVKRNARGLQVTFGSLNALDLTQIEASDIILLVASTTGSGAFPANGADFAKAMGHFCESLKTDFSRVRLSVFGVGDSAYPNFNAAAITTYNLFHQLNVLPIAGGLIKADVASETLPLRMFNHWSDAVESALVGGKGELSSDPEESFVSHAEMLRNFGRATVISKTCSGADDGLITLTLDGIECADMAHLRLLPTNSASHVARAITALGISDPQLLMPFSSGALQQCSYGIFFTSLFAGFRLVDESIIHAVVDLAESYSLLDLACLVPSNPEKKRVQGYLLDKRDTIRAKLVEQEGYVYVCGSAAMTEGVRANLSEILAGEVKQIMGERYVEEVF